jgi:hypothetical protein
MWTPTDAAGQWGINQIYGLEIFGAGKHQPVPHLPQPGPEPATRDIVSPVSGADAAAVCDRCCSD